jgi:hypothetical protein
MPKQPGGITKFERIQAVKTVLSRWGRLAKGQIDQHVATTLNCPVEELERALYRDLEELERMGEIVAIHYARDGSEIEDYDPQVHRNTVCRWAVPGAEHSILGSQKLKENQINFLCSPRMREAFEVRGAKEPQDETKIHLYFQVEGRAYCLRFAKDALPAKIVLGRLNEELKVGDHIRLVEEAFGKRASNLLVPIGNLSKPKDKTQPGHLCLEFNKPGFVTLRDLKSKNGTYYITMDKKRAEGLIRELAFSADATVTDSASRFREQMVLKTVDPGTGAEVPLPVLVRASQAFELILY